MGKTCQLSLLKQGAGQRVNVDLEDGATVDDLLKKIAGLKSVPIKEIHIVQNGWMDRVKLNKNEIPEGEIYLGGVDDLDGLPDIMSVEKVKLRDGLTKEEASAMQDDWVALYTQENFANLIHAFQEKFKSGDMDPKKYKTELPKIIRPYQKSLFSKWNFGSGARAALTMQMAFQPHDNDPDIQAKAAVLNALLGIDMAWLPESMQSS